MSFSIELGPVVVTGCPTERAAADAAGDASARASQAFAEELARLKSSGTPDWPRLLKLSKEERTANVKARTARRVLRRALRDEKRLAWETRYSGGPGICVEEV